ncbi:MAG: aldo/keto reductase [Propionibacteriales bacterium]|nr:aldo/keto reductase [Propionibacteriales bacterium]
MPMIGLGTWQARGSEAYDAVLAALEIGYRQVDTATMYGNEADIGRAIREGGVPREDVFVTTKMPPDRAGGGEDDTLTRSLRLLGFDYVDLWLVHWPPGGRARADTWERFLAARERGLTRAVGVSNYSLDQIDELVSVTGEAPAVNQIKWGPSLYDAGVLEAHRERGVAVEGYSPFRSAPTRSPVLSEVADAHGVTPRQVVLRWHLEHDVVAIPKSARRERIAENFDIFGFALTDEERSRIDALAGR